MMLTFITLLISLFPKFIILGPAVPEAGSVARYSVDRAAAIRFQPPGHAPSPIYGDRIDLGDHVALKTPIPRAAEWGMRFS
jgi:hypothetical protein